MNPQQQQQPVMPPTNDFLSRMDVSNGMTPEDADKKGLSKGVIVGIIVGIIAVVGVIVAVIMMNSNNPSMPSPTSTAYVDPEPEIDEEMIARNKLRAKDLLPVREAINKYQADTDGLLPDTSASAWTEMIENYGPDGGIKDGADGEKYTVGKVCKFSETCVDIQSLSWEENKHKIYVYYNADCGGKTKDNVIVSSTRARRAAIFAITEGDQFICTTNGE